MHPIFTLTEGVRLATRAKKQPETPRAPIFKLRYNLMVISEFEYRQQEGADSARVPEAFSMSKSEETRSERK